jgi:hypothetical protein
MADSAHYATALEALLPYLGWLGRVLALLERRVQGVAPDRRRNGTN